MTEQQQQQQKFCLLYTHDWSRHFDYFENDSTEDILNKLDNWSLFQAHKHFVNLCCDIGVRGKKFYYDCVEIIRSIAEQRNFNIWLEPDFIEENPIAPLKKYKGESWVNHPLE